MAQPTQLALDEDVPLAKFQFVFVVSHDNVPCLSWHRTVQIELGEVDLAAADVGESPEQFLDVVVTADEALPQALLLLSLAVGRPDDRRDQKQHLEVVGLAAEGEQTPMHILA